MADQVHRWLAVVAAALVLIAVVGWRSVRGTAPSAPAGPSAIPSPQLSQLIPYSKPLSDTIAVRHEAADSVVLRRDPFTKASLPQIAQAGHVAITDSQPRPEKLEETKWNVSATLTGGPRRAAIINDELVYIGDSLPGGMRLTSVEHDRVVLTDPKGAAHTVAVKEGEG